MKTCKDCGQTKPLMDFFRSKQYYSSYCKPCKVLRRKAWGAANPERLRELTQSSRARRRLALREYGRAWYAAHSEPIKASVRAWAEANSDRVRLIHGTKSKVRRAIAKGLLTRAQECQFCDATGVPIEAAHSDYTRPLDVTWLCRPCHRQWDRATPKTLRAA